MTKKIDAKKILEKHREAEEKKVILEVLELERLDAAKAKDLAESLKDIELDETFAEEEDELLSILERELSDGVKANTSELESDVRMYETNQQSQKPNSGQPEMSYTGDDDSYHKDEYDSSKLNPEHEKSTYHTGKIETRVIITEGEKMVDKLQSMYKS